MVTPWPRFLDSPIFSLPRFVYMIYNLTTPLKDNGMQRDKNIFMGCFVGLAVSDAMGAPLEFCLRGRFEPVTDMIEGGKLEIKKVEYTDDTAMVERLFQAHPPPRAGNR
jgi:hypothetical protein